MTYNYPPGMTSADIPGYERYTPEPEPMEEVQFFPTALPVTDHSAANLRWQERLRNAK